MFEGLRGPLLIFLFWWSCSVSLWHMAYDMWHMGFGVSTSLVISAG